jgi:Kdo2-lipid IVA lauroyltransferase/acyltransferase
LKFILDTFLNGIASLPFPLLYRLSDILYFLVYHVFKYRRDVVEMNMRNAFPEKSKQEIRELSRQFFKDLADLSLETIKLLKIDPEELKRRVYIADNDAARKYFAQDESTIMLTAHFGNWEWASQLFGLQTHNRPVQAVYMKLKSSYFNDLMKRIRTRFGNSVVNMEYAFKQILLRKKEGIVTGFMADQTPQRHQAGLWTMFFNQMTPFFTGPEKIATRLNLNVYFAAIYKEKRGFYRIEFTLITDKASSEPENYITEEYARLLEKSIIKQPSTWLWSHRRWKHKYLPD